MGIGDWGLGIGGWGIWPKPQNPKPKTQNPKPNLKKKYFLKKNIYLFLIKKKIIFL